MHSNALVYRVSWRPRHLRAILLLLAILPPLAAQQATKPGDTVSGAAATALVQQIQKEQDQLIEERRQALLKMASAASDADRAKILLALVASQQAERAQLRQDTAKVPDALKQAQEANRPVKPTKG